jgi:hypothetical protein
VASIYSTRLAAGTQSSGSSSSVYTVPSGATVVLRDISLAQTSGTPGLMAVALSGGPACFTVEASALYVTEHEEGRWIFNAGDNIIVDAVSGDTNYFLSGYVLLS